VNLSQKCARHGLMVPHICRSGESLSPVVGVEAVSFLDTQYYLDSVNANLHFGTG